MKTEKIIQVLKDYNKWRRGRGKYAKPGCMPNMLPKELGEAIDAAIEHLSKRMDVGPFLSLVQLADEAYAKYRRESRNCGRNVPAGYATAMADARRVVRYLMARKDVTENGKAKRRAK